MLIGAMAVTEPVPAHAIEPVADSRLVVVVKSSTKTQSVEMPSSSMAKSAVPGAMANSSGLAPNDSTPATTAPDGNWGWGAADLAQAYTDRDRVETGTFTSTGDDFALYAISDGASGDRATLCWNRVAGFASGGRSAGGGAAKALVDLDLHLYDASDGDSVVSSESTVDSVEQIAATSALTKAVLN